jgi:hypothetical protein
MKKLIFSILLTSKVYCGFSQDSIPRLSFEFGYSKHLFRMDTLNDKLIEPAINASVKYLNDRIESGVGYNFKIGFQLTKTFQFGVFGDFQHGFSEYNPMLPMGNNPSVEGFYSVNVENLNYGIHLTYWLSSIFNKSLPAFIQRLNYGFSAQIGRANGTFKHFIYSPIDQFSESYNRIYSNSGISLSGEFKVEYQFNKKHIFSSLGFKVGYQNFRTDYLKTKADEYEMLVGFPNTKMQLDFSGFYYGIYIKLAR